MAEYVIRAVELATGEIIETFGPYYSHSKADYQAKKVSRLYTSPGVVVGGKDVGWYRMGRKHKL